MTGFRLAASALALVALVGVGLHDSANPDEPAITATHASKTPGYVQPAVAGMKVGDTATTTTTPPAAPSIAKAVPVKHTAK